MQQMEDFIFSFSTCGVGLGLIVDGDGWERNGSVWFGGSRTKRGVADERAVVVRFSGNVTQPTLLFKLESCGTKG